MARCEIGLHSSMRLSECETLSRLAKCVARCVGVKPHYDGRTLHKEGSVLEERRTVTLEVVRLKFDTVIAITDGHGEFDQTLMRCASTPPPLLPLQHAFWFAIDRFGDNCGGFPYQ